MLNALHNGRRHARLHGQAPPHGFCDRGDAGRELIELIEGERLRTVGKRMVGAGMDFDHQPVRTRRDAGESEGRHECPLARGMAWVDEDRQVAHALDHRYRADVESIARRRLESTNSPLAEDHIGVSLGHDVFGGQEPLFHEHGQAALEHDGLARFADLLQQQVVLLVTGADLEDIGEFTNLVDVGRGHHLSDDRHTCFFARGGQDLQTTTP